MKERNLLHLAGKIVIALLVIYAAATLVTMQIKISEAKANAEQYAEEVDIKNRYVDELTSKLEKTVDSEYILKEARERFDYVMPGERIFEDTQN